MSPAHATSSSTPSSSAASHAGALSGSCHCRNVSVLLRTSHPPASLVLRACQCSFCVRHGARTTSDPEAELEIRVADPSLLSRYRFGLRLADFFVCSRCGVYVAAVMSEGGRDLATLNVNVLDARGEFVQPAEQVSYASETVEERLARRRSRWTPARILLGPG
jgi:hypothetical protein